MNAKTTPAPTSDHPQRRLCLECGREFHGLRGGCSAPCTAAVEARRMDVTPIAETEGL